MRVVQQCLYVALLVCFSAFFGQLSSINALAAEKEVVVFAAASTTDAVKEIAALYTSKNMGTVKTSFASSSTLAKQIANGAPADVFISANEEWMDFLEEKTLIVKGSRIPLLGNSIVLIVPEKSEQQNVTIAAGFSIVDLLGKNGRLAVGDPNHVPAGMYSKTALENLGSWDAVKTRLAPTKDVRAALALVEQGEVPLGMVYATDAAVSAKVRVIGQLPADSHPSVIYPAGIIAAGNTAEAEKFLAFLTTPEVKDIFKKYGFEVQ